MVDVVIKLHDKAGGGGGVVRECRGKHIVDTDNIVVLKMLTVTMQT